MKEVPDFLNLNLARKIINGMIKFSQDNNMLPGSYAVVDKGGHLIAFERRDNALPLTCDLAIDKAWTAATMLSARQLEVITSGQIWRLNVKYKGRLTIIPGTVPLISHNRVIGGIGHSGESPENDERISQAGLSSFYIEDDIKINVEPILSQSREIANELMEYVISNKLNPVAITITDEYGWPYLIYRMDGTPSGFLEISRDRAWTAAVFSKPSDEVEENISYTIGINWNERLNVSPGGIPFKLKGFSGAIGVAGNKPDVDKLIAINIIKKYQ
ncbi:GlcG/HbpS family heme-binding protein [Caldisphaera lagunensis]|nr:heme-binding protein [Caldisphaera lagunensis]